jgi:hypothetical protein
MNLVHSPQGHTIPKRRTISNPEFFKFFRFVFLSLLIPEMGRV